VNLARLVQNAGMGDGEVVELLRIANGYLPRVRLEYDRLKADLNSLKADISNSVRIYQDFCDRNLEMNKRINELQVIVDELEAKKTELKKSTTESNQHLAEFQENDSDNDNFNLGMEQEVLKLINEISIPPPT
jgi:chromosome segregation ATPase